MDPLPDLRRPLDTPPALAAPPEEYRNGHMADFEEYKTLDHSDFVVFSGMKSYTSVRFPLLTAKFLTASQHTRSSIFHYLLDLMIF